MSTTITLYCAKVVFVGHPTIAGCPTMVGHVWAFNPRQGDVSYYPEHTVRWPTVPYEVRVPEGARIVATPNGEGELRWTTREGVERGAHALFVADQALAGKGGFAFAADSNIPAQVPAEETRLAIVRPQEASEIAA